MHIDCVSLPGLFLIVLFHLLLVYGLGTVASESWFSSVLEGFLISESYQSTTDVDR